MEVYHEQWRELLTEYGELFEVWLDGANGGDGYYGGACESRSIDAASYCRNAELLNLFRELQPQAVVSGGPDADLRWCGNEHGFTSFTNWCSVEGNESLTQAARDLASIEGQAGGKIWRPTEVDLSLRRGWFWHAQERPHDAFHSGICRYGPDALTIRSVQLVIFPQNSEMNRSQATCGGHYWISAPCCWKTLVCMEAQKRKP